MNHHRPEPASGWRLDRRAACFLPIDNELVVCSKPSFDRHLAAAACERATFRGVGHQLVDQSASVENACGYSNTGRPLNTTRAAPLPRNAAAPVEINDARSPGPQFFAVIWSCAHAKSPVWKVCIITISFLIRNIRSVHKLKFDVGRGRICNLNSGASMRILIVEDDRLMSRSIELMLGGAGLEYDAVATGREGLDLARARDYDAIILDLDLPDLHGSTVLDQLRHARITTPVLILSGNGALDSKVAGFELGADDYVTKPFQRAEFLARVHALVRRSKGLARSIVTTGPIAVDLANHTVAVSGRRVHLTGKEFAILEMLTLRKGATLSKEMLLGKLYGGRDEPEIKIIDVFVCKLRKKLFEAGAGASGCIETAWGRGYALRDPESERPVQSQAA